MSAHFMSHSLEEPKEMFPQLTGKTVDVINTRLSLPSEVEYREAEDEMSATPFEIHSSVLDSVFSNVLDEHAQLQDHTPMFDELDFIIDGAKVNGRDEWVALFGEENAEVLVGDVVEDELADIRDEDLADAQLFRQAEAIAIDHELKSRKRMYSEVEETFEFTPRQDQLFTPNVSSTLPTPLLDSHKKIDHLGVTSYSKKQRSLPLAPVETENGDPITVKRAKNTEAARRSRARKMERMSQLEVKVEDLIKEKESLESEVQKLKEMLLLHGLKI